MPSRRDVLAGAGTISVTALAGCSALDGMPHGITIAVGDPDPTPNPADESEQVLRYGDLSTPEQTLVRKGLDGGYRTCEDVPDAANDLTERIDAENVYLDRRGERYGLWLTITDLVYASTTDPPDGECGWL